ncbi:hypothetical protein OEZ85_009840 [Tetradesmus obliquus]|uniref:STIL N-terminal domain-containing protein n=1 Tax=Tetradesmus obliquus TaxID=3088 RepID=A0ABY8UFD3_TETOB|nr:hypothetical protein OEZ85_009840 [Tetradesmus obliquus]
MQGPRGLRFPSSRRYLWDRTPAGAQVLINTQDHVPHVQVAASAFGAITRAAERQTGTVPLQLGISVTPPNQVTALVQELDPLVCKAGAYLQLSCPVLKHAQQQDAAAPNLRAALQAQLDQRSSAHVQELYALSASAVPAAAPGERVCLQLLLQMPSCSMLATPLYTKRLCHVPLAEALLKPGGMTAWQSGFLSMDQARSLLPLEATDVNVYSMPLVGVWVKGPSSPLHPLVAAACLRFAFSSLLADRAVNADTGAFLLLLCPEGDPVSKCYEAAGTYRS